MPRHHLVVLGIVAVLLSVASFLYFFQHDQLLLYGDAVAHINIARRVFDSQQPGLVQLGTVWLPLPHLLMMPFIVPDWAWRTGAGASLVSMAAYVLGSLGIFRLVNTHVGRKAGWLAALAYLANPNLIYLQTTAMTEPLYLALFIWAVAFLNEFFEADRSGDQRCATRSLRYCMLSSAAMVLTRYDGWFVAAVFQSIVFVHIFREPARIVEEFRRSVLNFLLPVALVPMLWVGYNYVFFGDAFAFVRGPYSARAIAARSAASNQFTHPGHRDVRVASVYFLKAAQLNMGERGWGRGWLIAALAGALATIAYVPQARVLLLLWLPLPFYGLSIAYAGAPIFIPVWWPFSYYNVRYGLELLPAICVFGAILLSLTAHRLSNSRLRLVPVFCAAVLLVGSYISVWGSTPICLREARANSVMRIAFEQKLAQVLAQFPSSSTALMYTGDHVGALQRAGIRLRRTVNETLHHTWEQALHDPASAAEYVVAIRGDPVWHAVQGRISGLQELAHLDSPGQPSAVIYKANPYPK